MKGFNDIIIQSLQNGFDLRIPRAEGDLKTHPDWDD